MTEIRQVSGAGTVLIYFTTTGTASFFFPLRHFPTPTTTDNETSQRGLTL
jgi:hypothetical protein